MAGASVASRRLDAPNISRGGMPVACREPGDRNIYRYERGDWQKAGSGQGLQATRWRVRSGGCVVAAGMARWAAPSGPDTRVAAMECRGSVAPDVLAGTTVTHPLPATQSQAVRGMESGAGSMGEAPAHGAASA